MRTIFRIFKAIWFVNAYGKLTKENYCVWQKINLTKAEIEVLRLKARLN